MRYFLLFLIFLTLATPGTALADPEDDNLLQIDYKALETWNKVNKSAILVALRDQQTQAKRDKNEAEIIRLEGEMENVRSGGLYMPPLNTRLPHAHIGPFDKAFVRSKIAGGYLVRFVISSSEVAGVKKMTFRTVYIKTNEELADESDVTGLWHYLGRRNNIDQFRRYDPTLVKKLQPKNKVR